MSLFKSLAADLAEESQEDKVGVGHSQHKYEALMAESAASRAERSRKPKLRMWRARISLSKVGRRRHEVT